MAFQYLTNTAREKAQEEYFAKVLAAGFQAEAETVPVTASCGRITAAPVYAHICAPHYPAAAMDGIALSAASTFGATETTPVVLKKEEFVPVDTGDPVPEGTDAVIMIEDVLWEEDGSAKLYAPASPWQHIRQVGEDICAGEMILSSGMRITPSAVGAFLAGGVLSVSVRKKPVVGILPTGDEIVPPTADPRPGDIIEFNSSIFSGMLSEWDMVPKVYPIVKDTFGEIRKALLTATGECDIVLINAGSSAGRDDYTAQVIAECGSVLFHGIAIKPGKPAILGLAGKKPVIGVPGYPVSGILVLELFVKPLAGMWYKTESAAAVSPAAGETRAVLSRAVVSGLKYEEFVRVRLGKVNGKIAASPLNRGSGMVTSFMKADGIVRIPQGTEGYPAGETVQVSLLRPEQELENTIVAIGSHDPLLDELAELLHAEDPSMFFSSSHVGSMGGIMAVKRGECHLAGTHLLDEADGTYNTSYIRKNFPAGGVRLVECVGRVQGIMVQKGNPLGIAGIADLTKKGLRYVNRQKGSGTRVLMDFLCKKEGIDPAKIYGYDREEFTHTSVAAQIASGTADAGMGILSAAKIYDLDFLPVCLEQYDLLIPDDAWDLPGVQKLLGVLQSEAFKKRLTEMGGYELCAPGSVRERF